MSELICDSCGRRVKSKSIEAGKYWTLRGWMNADGVKFYGGSCLKCYENLSKGIPLVKRSQAAKPTLTKPPVGKHHVPVEVKKYPVLS